MRSPIVKRIINNTHRKSIYDVRAYVDVCIEGIKKRFHYKFSWKDFNIGFGFCKTRGTSGWTYRISFDLGFYSCWIYFVEFKKNKQMKTPKEYAEELTGKHFVMMTNDLSFDKKRAIAHAKIDVQNIFFCFLFDFQQLRK